MEVVGYAARAAAHNQTSRLMPYAIQSSTILLAPILFAASIYMTLGRVIRAVDGGKHSIIRPNWLTTLFVLGDVFSLAVQSGGAGLMVTGDHAELSQAIVISGLVLQIIIFGFFWTTTLLFHLRMRRDPAVGGIPAEVRWEQTLWMLYGVSALIMARSVFRVIEFAMGHDGYLLSTEWPLYVFDSVPMFVVMVISWKWFPSTVNGTGSSVLMTSLGSLNNLTPGTGATKTENRSGLDKTAVQ